MPAVFYHVVDSSRFITCWIYEDAPRFNRELKAFVAQTWRGVMLAAIRCCRAADNAVVIRMIKYFTQSLDT